MQQVWTVFDHRPFPPHRAGAEKKAREAERERKQLENEKEEFAALPSGYITFVVVMDAIEETVLASI